MIRMKVSEEHFRHIGRVDCDPGHSCRQAPAGVEQQSFRPCFDQRADAQSLCIEGRPASRPEQDDANLVTAGRDGFLRANTGNANNNKPRSRDTVFMLPFNPSLRTPACVCLTRATEVRAVPSRGLAPFACLAACLQAERREFSSTALLFLHTSPSEHIR